MMLVLMGVVAEFVDIEIVVVVVVVAAAAVVVVELDIGGIVLVAGIVA